MKRSIIIGLVIGVLFGLNAKAADIRHSRISDDAGFIVVEGTLEQGDEQRFDAAVQQYSKRAVLFQSEGGALSAGIRMGEIIRMKNLSPGVAPGTMCASACALAWLGGTSGLCHLHRLWASMRPIQLGTELHRRVV
ncbi:hypothetical protein DC522_26765 [Microvirga sp. KLBC 81]|nr:hypothetical protein DC522_26765 [Microvirga sp. KLBC 81]